MELLIGCGSRRDKMIGSGEWEKLVTLDLEESHHPDVVHDLNDYPWPFPDDEFDEIHAYEVLEHLGRQGDYRSFFATFSEAWRILKDGGLLCATCPAPGSPWVWGDPGHTRQISPHSLVFLDQTEYTKQIGVTPMSDYRSIYSADFERVWTDVRGDTFGFVLRARKTDPGPSEHELKK